MIAAGWAKRGALGTGTATGGLKSPRVAGAAAGGDTGSSSSAGAKAGDGLNASAGGIGAGILASGAGAKALIGSGGANWPSNCALLKPDSTGGFGAGAGVNEANGSNGFAAGTKGEVNCAAGCPDGGGEPNVWNAPASGWDGTRWAESGAGENNDGDGFACGGVWSDGSTGAGGGLNAAVPAATAAGGMGVPKAETGADGTVGWFWANGFSAAPNFGANGVEGDGAGAVGSAAGVSACAVANTDNGCELAGCGGATVCIGGLPKVGAGEPGSTRFT